MKDQRKCMEHFEDKGMFPKLHWRILEDLGRFLGLNRLSKEIFLRLETGDFFGALALNSETIFRSTAWG